MSAVCLFYEIFNIILMASRQCDEKGPLSHALIEFGKVLIKGM